MPKNIVVTLSKSRHKSQPWAFLVDMPGGAPEQTNNERYSSRRSAWKGALRFCNACKYAAHTGHFAWLKGQATPIKFVTKDKTKRAQA